MLNIKFAKELVLSIGEASIEFLAATIAAYATQNVCREIRYKINRKKYNRPKPLTKPLKK